MRNGKGNLTKAVLCGVVVVAMSCVVATTGGSESNATTAAAPDFYNTETANHAASDMGQRLLADLPALASYAGLRIVPSGIEIDVVGRPVQSMLASVATGGGSYLGTPIPVTYRLVARTQQVLNAIGTQVMADQSWWAGQGVTLTSWGIDLDSNTMMLKLARYSDAAANKIRTRYGDGVSVYPADSPVTASSDRGHDTSPWFGGDDLNVAGLNCSSYFSLLSNATGARYNATAAHCGAGNVYERLSGLMQGDVAPSYQHWTNGGNTDVELYRVSSNDPEVWADPTTGVRAVTARSTGDPIGTLLCTDGATDREVCGVRIVSIGSVSYGGKTLVNQVYCEQVNDQPAFSGGDSGGPVYAGRNGSTEAQAFGMLIAREADPAHGWYTPLRYIFAAYPNVTFTPYS